MPSPLGFKNRMKPQRHRAFFGSNHVTRCHVVVCCHATSRGDAAPARVAHLYARVRVHLPSTLGQGFAMVRICFAQRQAVVNTCHRHSLLRRQPPLTTGSADTCKLPDSLIARFCSLPSSEKHPTLSIRCYYTHPWHLARTSTRYVL